MNAATVDSDVRASRHARFESQVIDACTLLAFALERGVALEDAISEEIRRAEDIADGPIPPTVAERVRFDLAYRQLSAVMAPVSVESLRATDDACGTPSRWGRRISVAKRWSRILWAMTGVAVVLTLAVSIAADTASSANAAKSFLGNVTPFVFGALGALAYLLRSCHEYIHRREFDPRRTPEYYNRILLGAVSGGATKLIDFGDASLAPQALAFIAGYNTDFLFTAIERLAAAVLPKVGSPSTAAETPVPAPALAPQLAAAEAQLVDVPSPADLWGDDTFDMRVDALQRYLGEIDDETYRPGDRQGYFDERTRAAIVAFLRDNLSALPAYANGVPIPDLRNMDRERLIALMNSFIVPETRQ